MHSNSIQTKDKHDTLQGMVKTFYSTAIIEFASVMTEGEKKNWGGPDVIGGGNLHSPVAAEVQNIGGPVAPLPPPHPGSGITVPKR